MTSSISGEEWSEMSEDGDKCGFIGCFRTPVWDCHHCGHSYCITHKDLHRKTVEVERILDDET